MLQKIEPNTFIVTFDATNLYGNIFLEFWIGKYQEALHPKFNKI